MDTFRSSLKESRPSQKHIPSGASYEAYQIVPSEEHEDITISQATFHSAGDRNSDEFPSNHAEIPTSEISLPFDRALSQQEMPNWNDSSVLSSTISMTEVVVIIAKMTRFLIPSFAQQLLSRSSTDEFMDRTSKIQTTTYLNGVRGLAAFFVFNQHYAISYYPSLDNGYMSSAAENHYLQMPLIRILYSGRFMVAIFFVLSGFVLSYKPLQLLRRQDPALLDCLASSAFRRMPRLFLPCVAPMFAASICIYRNWYGVPGANVTNPNFAPVYPNFFLQVLEELLWLAALANPFTWVPFMPPHIPQLWTLPLEFRGSMVVFLLLLCLSRAKVSLRMSFLALFGYYCLLILRWDTFLFVSGILFAEIHQIKRESSYCLEDSLRLLNIECEIKIKLAKVIFGTLWVLAFAFGLFLGSWPVFFAEISPGLITLNQLTPSQYATPDLHGYFWNSIGAVLVIAAFENFPLLQRPFVTPLARYLGDISFSFYIVHWTAVWSIGRYVTNEAIAWSGSYHWGFVIGALFVIPMTLWVADIHWRMFDLSSVRFSRWLWLKCSTAKPLASAPLSSGQYTTLSPRAETIQMTHS